MCKTEQNEVCRHKLYYQYVEKNILQIADRIEQSIYRVTSKCREKILQIAEKRIEHI